MEGVGDVSKARGAKVNKPSPCRLPAAISVSGASSQCNCLGISRWAGVETLCISNEAPA